MHKQVTSYVGFLVLLAVSFLVLYGAYGYVIAFQSETNDCFFLFGRQFLGEFFDHPAGPLRYAGRFLGQFYHYRWLGALIASACVTGFGVLFYRVLGKLESTAPVSQTLVPCVLLVALHTSTLYVLHDTLGLCAACGAFLGYLSLRGRSARRAYALAATPIVYLLLGVYAWLFVAWVALFEWLDGRPGSGLVFKIVYVPFSMAVPLVAWRWVFPIPLTSAVMCPIMFGPPFRTGAATQSFAYFVVDCVLAVLLVALVLLIPFWGRLFSRTPVAGLWRVKRDRRSRVALVIATVVLAILLHVVRYDGPLARVVACRRLYKQRQWDALLEKAKRNRSEDLRLQFMTNFALYRKGRLLDEMFHYPQAWGTRGLVLNFSGKAGLSPAEDDTSRGMYNSDLFYEMGHVNAAFRHAYNQMWAWGPTYDVLERMAECSMANGNYELASKYLNLLDRTLFHRRFARRYQAMIADPQAADREFGDLRNRLPVVEGRMFGHPGLPLRTLFESNLDNRMAFEYLVAWLLLDKQEISLATIGANVEHFERLGYASMPTHCQEALLLAERARGGPGDGPRLPYDEATAARVDRFFQDLSGYEDLQSGAEQARDRYGDTYMFYYFFVVTPTQGRRRTETGGGFGGTLREE